MKRKFTNGLLALAVMVAGATSLVSCKDYEEDRFQELQAEVQKDATLRTTLQNQVNELSTLLAQLQAQQALCQQNCSTMQASLANYLTKAEAAGIYLTKTQADGYYVSQSDYNTKVAAFTTQINALNTEISNLKAQDVLFTTQIDNLTTALNDAKTALNTKIDTEIANLKALLEGKISNLDTKIDNVNARVDAVNSAIATIRNDVAALTTSVNTLNTQMADVLARLAAVEALAAENKTVANQAATAAQQALNDAAAALTAANNAAAAAQSAAAAAQAAQGTADGAKADAAKAAADAQAAATKAQSAYDLANTANTTAARAEALANENKGKIDNLTTTVTNTLNTLTSRMNTIDSRIDGIDSRISSEVATINTAIQGINTRMDALELDQTAQWLRMVGMSDSLATAYTNALNAWTLAQANQASINSMNIEMVKIQQKLTEMGATDGKLKYSIDSLAKVTNDLYSNGHIDTIAARAEEVYKLAHAYADTVKNFVLDSINKQITNLQKGVIKDLQAAAANNSSRIAATNTRIDSLNEALNPKLSALENAYKAADSLLNKRIDTLNNVINTEIKPDIVKNTQAIEKLNNTFRNVMAKFITSVVLQGTRNDVIGYGALPVGIRSLVLAAYYGKNKTGYDLEFPTTKQRFYIAADAPRFTAQDMAMLGTIQGKVNGDVPADETILVDSVGNAGTLYLTVNPNTVDFTGTTFTLENSIQQASGVKLGDLTPSNYKLSFGYVRGEAANGFYEAKATVKKGDIAGITPRIDVQELKDVVKHLKNVFNRNEQVNITLIANAMYNNMSDVLDANAVKAQWTDSLGQHSVFSEYGIAATAIKPLSMGFMWGKTYERVPGLSRIEKFVDRFIDKIKVRGKYDKMFDIKNVVIKGIEKKADGSVTAEVRVVINKPVYDDYDNIIGTVDVDETYVVDITEEVNNLLAEYNGKLEEVAADINDVIDQLKDFSIQDMVTDVKTDIKNELHKYFDRINNKLRRFLTPNDALMPMLLVANGENWSRMSGVKNLPTKISGSSIEILPTSFTAEFLAPAYKKFVAVTNVYDAYDYSKSAQNGDVALENALKAVNKGDMNKVLDGGRLKIKAEGFQPGMVYEVAYSTVDYDGYVFVKKFYVKMK